MEEYKYTYTFKITPYKSWQFYMVEAQGRNVEEAKKVAREQFKQKHPELPKFRITEFKDWRVGVSMYD